jgi:uncharacterized SAM-binding protein YcdF (DUF218 family)
MPDIFFILSKVLWNVFRIENVIIISIFLALLNSTNSYRYVALIWLKNLVMLLLVILPIFPVGQWLIYPLETRFTKPINMDSVDGIIVLAGGVNRKQSVFHKDMQFNDQAERDIKFLELGLAYPAARLIYVGGSSSLKKSVSEIENEISFMASFFDSMGLNSARINFEAKSRNTYEGAVFAKASTENVDGENWYVITSAYHMARSVGSFCSQGWQVIPFPVDFRVDELKLVNFNIIANLEVLSSAAREWTGLMVYWLTGRIGEIVPSNCDA